MPYPRRSDELTIQAHLCALLFGGFMDVTLSDDEVETLRELLHDYLPELKFEVARADARQIRHALVQRQELCERLIGQLGAAPERRWERTS